MLRGRQAAGGRRAWDWVKPLGMQRLFTWGRADCGLSGYVMPACAGLCLLYNTKGKERKGTLYGVFSSWCSFLNLLSASVVGSLETHLMCVHIRHEDLSHQGWFIIQVNQILLSCMHDQETLKQTFPRRLTVTLLKSVGINYSSLFEFKNSTAGFNEGTRQVLLLQSWCENILAS